MKKILILGATSAIAIEVARCFAAEGASFVLAARHPGHLDTIRSDLLGRGAVGATPLVVDLANTSLIEVSFEQARATLDGIDLVLLAYGSLGDPALCRESVAALNDMLAVNFTSAASWLSVAARYFEKEKRGTIAAIGSVAGDRGRKSNYEYGAAKGALELFLGGLRNRLFASGVRVVTIKPGFVDTPMTKHLKKGPLFASAAVVGAAIHKTLSKPTARGSDVVYVPWFWRYILLIIRSIPEVVFKRLSI
jgi:decaprenylphospho-beta-D-erythro-pentofuranosid-2-ulose 2-reductase